MGTAVYNSAIPEIIWISVTRASRLTSFRVLLLFLLIALFARGVPAHAADWNTSEQQLAKKVAAVTGPGAVVLKVDNRSSLGRRDSEIVQNGLRSALEQAGLRLVKSEQAAIAVTISLSENPASYVWVAEIHQGTEASVVMVSIPRSGHAAVAHDSMPIALRKSLVWAQDTPLLDLTILEESGTPTRIAVLNSENVSLYRFQGGKWQSESVMEIVHARPWPRDLRGRLVPGKDHLFDAYLPGVTCHSSGTGPLALSCHETDDPWPIAAAASGPVFPSAGSANRATAVVSPTSAFFAPARNFFTGVLTPALGKFGTVSRFYSAAFVPREKYTLWLFAGTDGRVHLVDGMNDQASKIDWGSDITSVKTLCGAGWQILAAGSGIQAQDSVRAYELPDRDPVAVSAAVDFPGALLALWTESRGDTAIAIVKDRETGSYEAFRLDLACSQ